MKLVKFLALLIFLSLPIEGAKIKVKHIKAKPVEIPVRKTQVQKNIILDVGGVLLEPSKLKALGQLGLSTIFHTDIQDRFMEFIDSIEPNKADLKDWPKYKDRPLPVLMCKWQKGDLTCKQLVDTISDAVDKNPKFFRSKSEEKLIKKSAELLYAENHAGIERVKESGLSLLNDLKKNKKNKLYIISNFDDETFSLLEKKFPEIFGHFEPNNIVVSGRVNMVKPNKNIFEYALKQFKIDPKSCIFIDDQLENIEGARSCGIDAIHHTNPKHTRKKLKTLGIL